MDARPPAILRQIGAFFGVSLAATLVHYAVLVGLVEGFAVRPVPAALAGYVCGGGGSYFLNRSRTFASDRPHVEAGWRFAAVMGVGFCLTFVVMKLLVDAF